MKLADFRNGYAHITVPRGGKTILGCWIPMEGEYRIDFEDEWADIALYTTENLEGVGLDQQVHVVLNSAPELGLEHGYYTIVAWNLDGRTQDLEIHEASYEEIEYLNGERIWEDVTPRV